MHDYAIFGHNRSSIGRWLDVASIVINGSVTSFTGSRLLTLALGVT